MPQNRRVIVSLLTERQEFQRLQAEDARATAARTGLDVQILWAENDPVAQLQHVSQAVYGPAASRPAAIVVQPVAAAGLEGVARAAVQAGIGWVLLGDRATPLAPLQREFPGKLIASVGTDNDEIGRLQARLFRALLPRGGTMVYVEGPSFGAAAIHRRKLMLEGLVGSPIETVKVLSGDWTADSAERAAGFWLELAARIERPDLVGSQNDEMAVGVRKAIAALHPEWKGIAFTGVDGLPEGGQRMVRQKILTATIITPSPTGPSLEMVARALRGEKVPPFALMTPRVFPALEELKPVKG